MIKAQVEDKGKMTEGVKALAEYERKTAEGVGKQAEDIKNQAERVCKTRQEHVVRTETIVSLRGEHNRSPRRHTTICTQNATPYGRNVAPCVQSHGQKRVVFFPSGQKAHEVRAAY